MRLAEQAMERIFRTAAGIDVHRDSLVVTIREREDGSRDKTETRTFEQFHDNIVELIAWLEERQVEVVGLESTGPYWNSFVRELQLKCLKILVWLVNPLHVKKVPGRKTDVSDSQWLSKLVMYGLVSPSFLPSMDLAELRRLTRYRAKVLAEQTRSKNRVIKEVEIAGIKLASVCSDVLGKSGRAMLDALLEGTKTIDEMADLARGALRKKIPQLKRALEGSINKAARFVVRQLLDRIDGLDRDIRAIDAEIASRLQSYQFELELLKGVPGIDQVSAAAILAETGADMSVFPTAKNLTSWAGLCPGSDESAGKSKKAPTRKGDKYLRTILVQCAWSAVRTKGTFWKQTFGRLCRIGPTKAIVAIARKMLVAIFHMLRERVQYREPAILPPAAKVASMARNYKKRLEELGFEVTLAPKTAA